MRVLFATIAILGMTSNPSWSQEELYNDGVGDTPDNPDIWIYSNDDAGYDMTMPGDNQPVTESYNSETGTYSLDFDQPLSQDSETVLLPQFEDPIDFDDSTVFEEYNPPLFEDPPTPSYDETVE